MKNYPACKQDKVFTTTIDMAQDNSCFTGKPSEPAKTIHKIDLCCCSFLVIKMCITIVLVNNMTVSFKISAYQMG